MAIILALFGAFFSSLQSTLLASFYRSRDTLSVVAYRGVSLGLSMFPVILIFVDELGSEFSKTFNLWPLLLSASVFAAIGNWAVAQAFTYMPIGFSVAFSLSATSLIAILLDKIIAGGALGFYQELVILLLLISILLLGYFCSKSNVKNLSKGSLLCLFAGLNFGVAFYFVCTISQSVHPLVVGYSWELTIGVVSFLILLIRKQTLRIDFYRASLREFFSILLRSFPTVLGTGLFLTSSKLAPISLVTAVFTTQLVFSSLLAVPIEKEMLTRKQFLAIILTFVCLFLLKLVE